MGVEVDVAQIGEMAKNAAASHCPFISGVSPTLLQMDSADLDDPVKVNDTIVNIKLGVRLGLGTANLLHGVVGTSVMTDALDGLRKATGGRLPKWSPALARPVTTAVW